MYTKTKICNLTMGALLLQRRFVEVDSDQSNEAKILLTHWDTALRAALEDMDLDSTSESRTLELYEEDPNDDWSYAYKYPADCAFFRRIKSQVITDSRSTHIAKRVGMHENKKVIFTNEADAVAEIISFEIPLTSLSANAGIAIAYRLATLCAPLITGKGAQKLIEGIEIKYRVAKAEAQEHDKNENFNFVDEDVSSEFVAARTE